MSVRQRPRPRFENVAWGLWENGARRERAEQEARWEAHQQGFEF